MATKSITFSATEPLTVTQMNGLVQSSQIVQSIGTDPENILSQKGTKDYVESKISGGVNNMAYTNASFTSITTVKGALDYLFGIIQGQNTATKIKTKELDLVD